MVVTSGNKILIGYAGDSWSSGARKGIVRLNLDGTVDTSFNPVFGRGIATGAVYALALQPSGDVIAAGSFTTYADPGFVTVNRVVRHSSTGPRDAAFNVDTGTAANDDIWVAAVSDDGRIHLGGHFTTWKGQTVGRIVRLQGSPT